MSLLNMFDPICVGTFLWLLTTGGIIFMGINIGIDDIKSHKIINWKLLLIALIAIAGVVITRFANSFVSNGFTNWAIFLIAIPAWIVLRVLNDWSSKFQKIIGPADLDIFNTIVSISIPIIILLLNQTYDVSQYDTLNLGNEFTESANFIHLFTYFGELAFILLVCYLIILIITLTVWIINKRKNPKVKLNYFRKKIPVAAAFIPPLLYTIYIGCTLMT